MYLRNFGKIKLKFGLFFVLKYLKSIFLKNIYLSDINNKYFKFIFFVKKVIKRRLLVWYKEPHIRAVGAPCKYDVTIAIKYVML